MEIIPEELISEIETYLQYHVIPPNKLSKTPNQLANYFQHQQVTYRGIPGCTCEFKNAIQVVRNKKTPTSEMYFNSSDCLHIAFMLYPEKFGDWYVCCKGRGVSYTHLKRRDGTNRIRRLCSHGYPLKKKNKKNKKKKKCTIL